MRHQSIAIAAFGLTLLSGAAMAQGGNGKPRFDVEGHGSTAVAAPDTAAGLADWNYSVSTNYMSSWSSNPGTFNSQTAEPGFVDHSHGRP